MNAPRPAMLLLLLAAGCGEAPTAAPAPPRELRVLDPAGRLLDDRGSPVVIHLTAEGGRRRVPGRHHLFDAPPVFDLSAVPVGSHVLVRSRHCPAERVVVQDQPMTVVRLRRGIPVRVTPRYDGSLPAAPARLGIRLSRVSTPDEGDEVRLESVDPAAWDDDQNPGRGIVYVRARGEAVRLEVPEEGEYQVEWVFDAPLRRHSYMVRPFLRVERGAAEPNHVLDVDAWVTRALPAAQTVEAAR